MNWESLCAQICVPYLSNSHSNFSKSTVECRLLHCRAWLWKRSALKQVYGLSLQQFPHITLRMILCVFSPASVSDITQVLRSRWIIVQQSWPRCRTFIDWKILFCLLPLRDFFITIIIKVVFWDQHYLKPCSAHLTNHCSAVSTAEAVRRFNKNFIWSILMHKSDHTWIQWVNIKGIG